MNLSKVVFGSMLAFLVISLSPRVSWTRAAEDLLAKGKKEGVLEFYGPNQVGKEGAEQLRAAFNKKYGFDIVLKYTPSANMNADVGKVVTHVATGGAPEWDVMVIPDTHHAVLWLKKLHVPFEYEKLGIDPKVIHFDKGTVSFANQFVLPAYNKKILSSEDIPKSWEDLLDPKWKGRKLGFSTGTPAHLAALAAGMWGEEKTTKYVKGLAQQELTLGRLGELYNRLLLGEILVAVTLTNSFIFTAEKKGAPLVFDESVEPVISPAYHVGVLKGSRHPTLGHLFAAFLTTPEAQEIWEKHVGHTSAFVRGTRAYNYAQGKKIVFMTQDQAILVNRLTKEYSRIVGF